MMRYLLLSALVVCVIGVMIPSVFAYHVAENAGIMHSPVSGAPDPWAGCDIYSDVIAEVYADKETYQSGETVNLTVELFSKCDKSDWLESEIESSKMSGFEGPVGPHHDLRFHVGGYVRDDCEGCSTYETLRIRVGEQKTFQFEPEILTWEQEYRVRDGSRYDQFLTFYVLPAGGCGEGTVLVDGACQLAYTPESKSPFMSIDPLYYLIGVVAIGGIIGAIAVAKRGSKTPKPAKQELDEYEEQYLAKEKPVKQKPKPAKQKPVEKKEASGFCENCGNTLNPKAKFCGGCGTARS